MSIGGLSRRIGIPQLGCWGIFWFEGFNTTESFLVEGGQCQNNLSSRMNGFADGIAIWGGVADLFVIAIG